ncbi:flippase [Roseburia sp. MUC/MUC-530-WT-4D]|uniref:Flippase n=1 Tax=Roseburia porci TaxID=2605790 RepID=A0A6L5YRK9_9FIRM|nr:flippase [Roseburia porci]MST75080.1 flippase [Roseburia porci]
MAKQKSLKLNYIYNVSYQVLSLITPLITTPYVSRVLGADGIGDYSFTASVVTYFSMVAVLGTLTYGNREISYLQDDRKARSKLFWEIELLSFLSTGICTAAYLIFLLFCDRSRFSLYAIQTISIVCVAFDIAWLLQGMEEFGKVMFRNMLFKVINIVFIFTAVRDKDDLFLYVAGMVLLALASNLSIWFYLPQYIDRPVWKELHPMRHLKPTLALFIPSVAMSIYTVFDKTMIGLFSNNFENGYYEQALKISKTALTLVTALGAVMIPRMGYYFNQKNMDKVKELTYQSYNFVWFLGVPLSFGLIGISQNLVPWFYGKGYDKINVLLPILGLLIIIIGLSNVTGIQYFVTTKRERLLTATVIIGAVVNFICNLILIPKLYSIGASIASVAAEAVITLTQLYFIRNELSFTRIMAQSVKYLLAGACMLLVLFFENHYLSPSVLHSCIMIFSGAIVYFIALFILKDQFFFAYAKQVLQKLRHK